VWHVLGAGGVVVFFFERGPTGGAGAKSLGDVVVIQKLRMW